MVFAESASGNPIAIWSILSSIIGAVLVFALVRVAIILSRSGSLEAYAKKITDLNPCSVKLQLRIENGHGDERSLNNLSLYIKEEGHLSKASSLLETPLLRHGDINFVQGKGENALLLSAPHSRNECVVEFKLPSVQPQAYLVYEDKKGRKRKAKVSLGETREQLLYFHRF